MNTTASLNHLPARQATGFSLIELMIAVAIVGITSAVAIPTYSDYVTRGRIPDATSQLALRQVQMENFFQDNRTYVGAPTCNADTTSSKTFDYTCSPVSTAATFTLVATGKDTMLGFVYSVNQSGTKTTVSVPTGWTLPSPNNCWALKRGGSC
jgi:type IV pilus assembly protein PilE